MKSRADVGVLFVHGIGAQSKGATLEEGANALRAAVASEARFANADSQPDATLGFVALTDADRATAVMSVYTGSSHQRWLLTESHWADTFRPAGLGVTLRWIFTVSPGLLLSRAVESATVAFYVWFKLPQYWWRILIAVIWLALALPTGILLAAGITLVVLLRSLIPIQFVKDFLGRLEVIVTAYVGDSFLFTANEASRAAMATHVAADIAWLKARSDRLVVVSHSQGAAVTAEAILATSAVDSVDTFVTFGAGIGQLDWIRKAEKDTTHRKYQNLAFAGWMVTLASYMIVAILASRMISGVPIEWWLWVTLALALVWMFIQTWIFFTSPMWSLIMGGGMAGLSRWTVAIGTYVLLGAFLLVQAAGAPIEWWLWVLLAVTGLWLLFQTWALLIGISQLGRGARPDWFQEPSPGREFATRWWDIFASADPVPGGPSTAYSYSDVYPVRVFNHGNLFTDHTAYYRNRDEFVGRVLLAALQPPDAVQWSPTGNVGSGDLIVDRYDSAIDWAGRPKPVDYLAAALPLRSYLRQRRGRWLEAWRASLFLLAVAVLVRWWPQLAHGVGESIEWLAQLFPGQAATIRSASGDSTRMALAVLVVLLGAGLIYGITLTFWWGWANVERRIVNKKLQLQNPEAFGSQIRLSIAQLPFIVGAGTAPTLSLVAAATILFGGVVPGGGWAPPWGDSFADSARWSALILVLLVGAAIIPTAYGLIALLPLKARLWLERDERRTGNVADALSRWLRSAIPERIVRDPRTYRPFRYGWAIATQTERPWVTVMDARRTNRKGHTRWSRGDFYTDSDDGTYPRHHRRPRLRVPSRWRQGGSARRRGPTND